MSIKVPGFSVKSNVPTPPAHPKSGIKVAKKANKTRSTPGTEMIRSAFRQGDTSQSFAKKMQRIINKTDTKDDHNFYM